MKPKAKSAAILDHKSLINSQEVQRCFPVSDRTLLKLKQVASLRCKTPFNSFVEKIGPVATKEKEGEAPFEDPALKGKCAYFNIMHSSNLELDPNVMHPMVRIHLLDLNTGCYVRKSTLRSAVTSHETISTYIKGDKEFARNSCDIIIPFATKCFDLREGGNSRAIWNEGFPTIYSFFLEHLISFPDR